MKVKTQTVTDLSHSLMELHEDRETIRLWWLGQAGFAVRYHDHLMMIDPYLSDFLAKRYKDKKFAHQRMVSSPILPEQVRAMDWVMCTHRHSDHMDPETMSVIAENTNSRFIVPNAEKNWAMELNLPRDRILGVNAGERFLLADGVTITPVASAHEKIQTNLKGEHHFLGYVLDIGPIRLYHAGDCIPYPGLVDTLVQLRIDIALLPVNGRDAVRKKNNIPGNFTLAEAMQICDEVGIPVFLGHHFGMFDFNTIDVKKARYDIVALPHHCYALLAEPAKKYTIQKDQVENHQE